MAVFIAVHGSLVTKDRADAAPYIAHPAGHTEKQEEYLSATVREICLVALYPNEKPYTIQPCHSLDRHILS